MLTTSLELKNAFMQNERTISIRIKIGLRTFDNDDVISVEYNSGSLIGEVFAIGSTYSNSIKITFSNLVEGLKELDEVSYEIGIELPNGLVEYVPMGIFIINEAIEMDRNNNKTTIECMDKMVMMGGAYVSSLIFPAPIREVALEIANKAGIQVSDTFDRLSADKIAKPEGYTCREAIGLIAQFEAGFATFDRYGKLTIRGLSDPNFAIPPDNYFSKGLVKNEVFFRLGGISCTTDDNSDATIQSGNTLGNQIVLENRVMTKVLLDKIYQKIQIINYYPFSLKWQGNPILEAGDWIEVEDLEGNKFKTPNLNYKLTFNGGLSAESSAETATQSNATYQYKSPLQQKIEWINARIDAAGGNVIFEGIDQPVNPNEGDLWFKKVGPDTEIWIYTKDSIGNLSWEFKVSTAENALLRKEIEAAQQGLVEAKKQANDAVAKADKAITDAGFAKLDATTAKKNAVTAVNTANTAKTNAEKAISDVGVMSPKVTKAVADAAAAMLSVDVAKSNSEKALTVSQNSLTNSDEALIKAGQALGKATATEITTASLITSYDALNKTVGLKAEKEELNVLKGTVTQHGLDISANATAVGLKADKTLVDNINLTVSKHSLDIKAGADGLLLKADSSLVNTLKGTVDSQGLAITAAANGLTLKADNTLVNTIKGTVDTHTNQIKIVSDGLALKAESSLVNAIKGTVDSHTNQIGVNSQAINARLTSTQVDSILTAKKYVNETQLKATADGLQVGITKVSSDLANLEIGGRNVFKSSKSVEINWAMTMLNNTKLKETFKPNTRYAIRYKIVVNEKLSNLSGDIDVALGKMLFYNTTPGMWINGNSDFVSWYKSASIGDFTIATSVFTTPNDFQSGVLLAYGARNKTANTTSPLVFEEIMVVEGNVIPIDWSPAPEDMTTKVETADLEFKVDGIKTEFINKTIAIEGINTTQTANILANANGLKTKAETTTVNAIKGTVDIHTGQISANATGLISKAETSAVNTIKGTVDTHTTQISQNSTAIGLRLTSTQVESAITAKKYVNETTFNATSSGLTASIASTDLELGKSNTRITNVEATANGLQTTVKNKAEQSQVTQIASQVASKVEGSVYNTKMTQLDSAINLRLTTGQVNESILNDKKIKDTRTTNQLPNWYYANYPKQTVEEFKQRAEMGVTGTAVYGQLTTQVQWDSSTGGSMTQIFNSSDGVFQRKSNVNNTWTAWEQTAEVSKIVAQINLSPKGVLIQGKNIQLDGDVAMDNAFVNRIKAIEVIADKITTGTLNGANVNLINLNASSITAGTFRGANYELDLNTGTQIFRNPNNGNSLIMNQGVIGFWNGNKSRYIEYWDEGLKIYPGSQNTGIAANTGLQLIGGHAYIDFVSNLNGNGVYQRLEASSGNMYIIHHADGSLRVRGFNGLESNGRITTGFFKTSHPQNATLTMWGDTINVPNDGNRNIHLVPNGTGSVIIGTWQGTRWNIQASDFVKVSSRATKTNILPLDKGLSTINSLLPVTYNKIDKLNRGINELEKGFIAEDSPSVSTPDGKGIYDSFIVAHLVKGMQELDARTASETDILKSRVTKLEQKIKLLESAA